MERLIVIEIEDKMYELVSTLTSEKYIWQTEEGDQNTVTDLNDFTQNERFSKPFEGPNKYDPFKELSERISSNFEVEILFITPPISIKEDEIY